jgi:hypothetical protein
VSKYLIQYFPQTPTRDAFAIDEMGNEVSIEFILSDKLEDLPRNPFRKPVTGDRWIRLNGVIHRCSGLELNSIGAFNLSADPVDEPGLARPRLNGRCK